jgi:CubicO group peptidase (beta-lactamase class C family)
MSRLQGSSARLDAGPGRGENRRHRWLGGFLVLVCLAGCTDSSSSVERPERSAGAEQAASNKSLDASFAARVDDLIGAGAGYGNVRAVLVAQHGKTVVERYYESRPDERRTVFSVTKSVVGTLVGIAEAEGLLRLDQTLAELLPQQRVDMAPGVASITLEQLLTMTSGIDDSHVFMSTDNPVEYILERGIDPTLQGSFTYSDAGVHLVAAVLTEVTGQSLLVYARSKLFDPLGIDTRPAETPVVRGDDAPRYRSDAFGWPTDAQGVHLGASTLRLAATDLLKLGQLYLDGGSWDGRQVVPAMWVEKATTPHVRVDQDIGYGYLWWATFETADPVGYAALGYAGQVIAVLPDDHLVIVATSDMVTARHPILVDSADLATVLMAIVSS